MAWWMQQKQEELQMVKIAVLGYGTVGSGVVEVLEMNKEKSGITIERIAFELAI